jgi:hypothetical protein
MKITPMYLFTIVNELLVMDNGNFPPVFTLGNKKFKSGYVYAHHYITYAMLRAALERSFLHASLPRVPVRNQSWLKHMDLALPLCALCIIEEYVPKPAPSASRRRITGRPM